MRIDAKTDKYCFYVDQCNKINIRKCFQIGEGGATMTVKITWLATALTFVSFITIRLQANIIFTYKNVDPVINNKADFSLTSNTIDNTLTRDRSDFVRDDPLSETSPGENFNTIITQSTSQKAKNSTSIDEPIPPIENSYAYAKYYRNNMQKPTDKSKLPENLDNLYSGRTFQLSFQPSDFNIISGMFKADPQLTMLNRYLIGPAGGDTEIFAGQRIVISGQTTYFSVGRQDEVGYRKPITSKSVYKINCQAGDTEFDVNELAYLPTYNITTQLKNCSIVYLGSAATA